LVRQSLESNVAGRVEQWNWLVGPGRTTAEFRFAFPVYLTTIGGHGRISLTQGAGAARTELLVGGTSLAIQAGTRIVISNDASQQIDIRATYLVGWGG